MLKFYNFAPYKRRGDFRNVPLPLPPTTSGVRLVAPKAVASLGAQRGSDKLSFKVKGCGPLCTQRGSGRFS